ncbi:MAG: Rieske (2Fe-2S) protein [Pirellulales bacterium]|nr:Rieske (2Fe-2S) protein [Pirellulales bacterium]
MAEEKKRPTVAEILAAARKNKPAEGTESSAPAAEIPEKSSTAATAATSPPSNPAAAPAKAAPPKVAAAKPASGGKPSVAEMLAMARAQKAGGSPAPAAAAATAAPAEKPAPAAKPAPKPAEKAADKAAAKPAAAKVVPKDTASILASARGGAKPGPVTKAEAAAAEAKEDKEATAAAKAKLAAVPPMPAKPDYAKPKPKGKEAAEISRRGMFGWIAGAAAFVTGSAFALGNTAMAMTGGLWTLGMARYMFPNILTEPPSRFKVGFKDAFAPGMVDTRFVSQFGVWVVNTEFQGQRMIYALRTVCTHLGCTPNWLEGEQKFKCPCHGSGFYKDGINFEGPAPRPLERYAIRIADDGQLEIDKSRMFQEELGQWADPSSFIPV